ncbi:AAA-associated domain-containing protein [Actinomadura barringtoniae]|uniref:AAA-associated domain-containing protein n=1 Tax=Actinomadura barringtoniae TaxID=1427535 RepID=A0A939PB95_9ACTN|nr:nitrate/sulfonate/bicarbonate ABC transporter ATP-binding protein [Actinomadura barringtoniae]MBO2449012.1 AAA-associated domain-containing protein [Actinomadura barringtoniae]
MTAVTLPTTAYGPLNRGRAPLISMNEVSQTFRGGQGVPLTVLDGVSFTLYDGEIVALLGRSGCGKSTLLRVMAGLIEPTGGSVEYRGEPVRGATPGVAMVFQSFALLPWLTVMGNVELGLEGVADQERRRRALDAIDVVGLDGFETAYPKELSGGMRQRAGFARALVREPDVLLMDEPFSALDVLTAENLRTELLELWSAGSFATRAMAIVTHNIEEAVLLADRILVLGDGGIKGELQVRRPRPRDRHAPAFHGLMDAAYRILTGDKVTGDEDDPGSPLVNALPMAPVGAIAGLADWVEARGRAADLSDLALELGFEADDLLPIVDAAVLLGLARLVDSTIVLTRQGVNWTRGGIQPGKAIFARLATENAPLVRTILRALGGSRDGRLSDDFFLAVLRRGFTEEEARRQLDTAIDWGRYGELLEYDAKNGDLVLAS